MNLYKTKLKRDIVQALSNVIQTMMMQQPDTDDDRLHIAVLAEVKLTCDRKLLNIKAAYGLTFNPAQALAIRILSTDYITDKSSHLGNRLHMMSNEILKQYS